MQSLAQTLRNGIYGVDDEVDEEPTTPTHAEPPATPDAAPDAAPDAVGKPDGDSLYVVDFPVSPEHQCLVVGIYSDSVGDTAEIFVSRLYTFVYVFSFYQSP